MPPDEEDRRPVRRPRGRLGKALHLDAVEQQHVVAVERVARGDARVLRHGAPEHQPRREPAHDRAQHRVGGAVTGAVEGADHRRSGSEERGQWRAGTQRLVQMEDVEALVAKGAQRPNGAGRVGRDRRDRPVGRERHRAPEGRYARLGRRAVARRQHACVDAGGPQCTRETHHLALDPARDGEAVRAHEADPHDRQRYASWTGGSRLRSARRRRTVEPRAHERAPKRSGAGWSRLRPSAVARSPVRAQLQQAEPT